MTFFMQKKNSFGTSLRILFEEKLHTRHKEELNQFNYLESDLIMDRVRTQIFAIFDYFSMFYSTFFALHFDKSSNMAKIWQNMRKSLVLTTYILALFLFLHDSSKIRNPGFGYPILH